MQIELKPIAWVEGSRKDIRDDHWGDEISKITLIDELPTACFKGLVAFSHIEVLFYFHKTAHKKPLLYGHPRGNEDWPEIGIFAQRKKNRPNRLGSTICQVLAVEGKALRVQGLDAIEGTPVLDIKPVFKEFLPRTEIIQPQWVSELMRSYW